MGYTLRPYQQDCVTAIHEQWRLGKRHQGVVLGTGSGKTHIFMDVIIQLLKKHPDELVLVLSHLSLLTTQTTSRFASFAPHVRMGVLQATTRPDADAQVIIGTMQSTRDQNKVIEWLSQTDKKVGTLVIDECHMLECESYDKILSYFKDARLLGMTATPFRAGLLMVNSFDKISYSLSLQQLIDMKYLVPPEQHLFAVDKDVESSDRIAMVYKLYADKEMGKQAIVFLRTIEEAKLCRNVFESHGVTAHAITCDATGKARDDILNDFNKGIVRVLTTVNVLTAGFDSLGLECIFMPYATLSPTLYMQRIGRGLRPEDGDSVKSTHTKQSCRVYTFGNPPAIKRGLYEKLNRVALQKGNVNIADAVDCFEELELMEADGDTSSTQYNWTKEVCVVAEKIKSMGMTNIYNLVIKKNFPPKFLRDLAAFENNLPPRHTYYKSDFKGLTKFQADYLLKNGFTHAQLDNVCKGEATQLISTMLHFDRVKGVANHEFTIASGKFAGKHVSFLFRPEHQYYRMWVLSKAPYSKIAKQITAYMRKEKQ